MMRQVTLLVDVLFGFPPREDKFSPELAVVRTRSKLRVWWPCGALARAGAAVVFAALAYEAAAGETRCAVLELFVRGDAERSRAAREFVEKTYSARKGLLIAYRDVAAKETDLARFYQLADHFQVAEPGLPAFYVSGRFECGWTPDVTPGVLEELLTIEVFVRQGCPRCASAKPVIFQQLAPRYPGYRFIEKDIAADAEAQRRLQGLANRYRVQGASVPALHLCGRLMVGFLDANASFRQWDDVLRPVTVPSPAKTSSLSPSRRAAPVVPSGFWSGTLYAGEVATEFAPEPSGAPPMPPETADSTATHASATRVRRELPPELPAEAVATVREESAQDEARDFVELPFIGRVNWRQWGLPAFTLLVGLVDGFNPCAMWVLLFLLSLLVNLKDRWKILAVAGTFVVISGAAYLAFMAAWLNVFQLIGLLRPAQIILGLLGVAVGAVHVKDFFAFKQGVSLSIPESAKPGLYDRMRRIVLAETLLGAVIGASVLAVLVNIIELLCTAGLPAMYTGILTMQQLPTWQNYAYLLLYIVGYMFDDSLMVAVVVATLGKHRLQERGGRWLKLFSGGVILALGLTMLFKPEWLG